MCRQTSFTHTDTMATSGVLRLLGGPRHRIHRLHAHASLARAGAALHAGFTYSTGPSKDPMLGRVMDLLRVTKASPPPPEEPKREEGPTRLRRPVYYRDLKLESPNGQFPDEMRWRMTETAKENLYADHCQDPEKWTIKALADKYGISPRRVPVIIQHMKIREEEDALAKKEAEKGEGEFEPFWNLDDPEEAEIYKSLNWHTGMEVEDTSKLGVPEPIIVNMTADSNPAFRVVDDEEMARFYERIAEQAEKEVPDLATGNKPTAPATVLRKDQLLRSRTRLVFTDISKGATAETRDIRIRQEDGTLRTASGEERERVDRTRYPSKRNPRLL